MKININIAYKHQLLFRWQNVPLLFHEKYQVIIFGISFPEFGLAGETK